MNKSPMQRLLATTLVSIFLAAGLAHSKPANALEPFVGEIKWFAGNFAPRGWAFCDGQIMAISGNEALFSLYGTIYGGDGRTTFALPDMRGRSPFHAGNGSGLTSRPLGSRSGAEQISVSTANMPSHSHSVIASTDSANSSDPAASHIAQHDAPLQGDSGNAAFTNGTPTITASMSAGSVGSTGSNQSANNMHPYLSINCIVSLFGVYPSRS